MLSVFILVVSTIAIVYLLVQLVKAKKQGRFLQTIRDLFIILFAFRLNYRQSQKYERIIITDSIFIKKINFKGKEYSIKIEPSWLRLKVCCHNNSGHLEIISKGKAQIIGNYLNVSELKNLAKEIKKALIIREKELSLNF